MILLITGLVAILISACGGGSSTPPPDVVADCTPLAQSEGFLNWLTKSGTSANSNDVVDVDYERGQFRDNNPFNYLHIDGFTYPFYVKGTGFDIWLDQGKTQIDLDAGVYQIYSDEAYNKGCEIVAATTDDGFFLDVTVYQPDEHIDCLGPEPCVLIEVTNVVPDFVTADKSLSLKETGRSAGIGTNSEVQEKSLSKDDSVVWGMHSAFPQ